MDEINIEKVENGYLVTIEDREAKSMRSFIYLSYSEVLNHLNGLEDESEDVPMIGIFNTGYEAVPVTKVFSDKFRRMEENEERSIKRQEDKAIIGVADSLSQLGEACWEAGLSIDQVIKLK